MVKKTTRLLFIFLILALSACAAQPSPQTPNSADSAPVLRSFPIRYAQHFTLEYGDGYKKLTVTQPWAGASEPMVYILVPRGSAAPANVANAQVLETPARSFVAMSTTYFPFLEKLGKLDALVAVDDATYTYNPQVREKVSSGAVAQVGGGAGGGSVNVEKLLELQPDLIMTSASGSPELDAHPKLLEAGLPVVINADYLEQSPLGRAEWGIFIAAFFDMEEQAARDFDALVRRYEAAKALTEGLSDRVTVFTNTDYQGTWYVPGGESYAALLLKDAGARYVFESQPGYGAAPLAFEAVFDAARDADFWLNVGFASDLDSLLTMGARYAEFKAFARGSVYNYNARVTETGGSDYFESGVANPDIILKDLIRIFYPELLPEHTLYYYQKLN